MRINHVDLAVPDVVTTRDFFMSHFGFKLTTSPKSEAIAVLVDDDFTLVLQRDEAAAYPAFFHVGFLVDDGAAVRKYHDRLRDSVTDLGEVKTNGRGTMFYCRPPGGFVLEVYSNP